MYSGAVETGTSGRQESKPRADGLPSDRWQDFPHSAISDHGSRCCDIARDWVIGMDFALLNGGAHSSGPRWLRARYKWGPSSWPIHWCEVVERKVIDCGAHAALAGAVFAARGEISFPAQLIQRYSPAAIEQWRSSWDEERASCHWLAEDIIYHEVVALLVGASAIKLWDASAGCWLDPRQAGDGYGNILAVRIFADRHFAEGLSWGERRLEPGSWNQIS